MNNSTIFHTQNKTVEIANKIKSFYQKHHIDLEFKSVVSYLNFKSYSFNKKKDNKQLSIKELIIDLAENLKCARIRVVDDSPNCISFEIYHQKRKNYDFFDAIEDEKFQKPQDTLLPILLGDRNGAYMADLAKMPHLLIGGQIGAGKSIFLNSLILSLLYHHSPETLKFVLVDPKAVELSIYNDIPHLLTPVVTDMKKVAKALRWCVDEMEHRYQLLSALRVRNIERFNEKIDEHEKMGTPIPNPIWKPGDTMDQIPPALQKLSYIVVIVDEFADLMMVAKKQIEEFIVRLAQKARAIGIHLILATQCPSVDVITGPIKANVPSRIAFAVATKIGSCTLLDTEGGECLGGRGDMLFSSSINPDLLRIQAPFVDDDAICDITEKLRTLGKPEYIEIPKYQENVNSDDELDPLFDDIVQYLRDTKICSVSQIQRHFLIGFNRAARIFDQLEQRQIVSPFDENGKRHLL